MSLAVGGAKPEHWGTPVAVRLGLEKEFGPLWDPCPLGATGGLDTFWERRGPALCQSPGGDRVSRYNVPQELVDAAMRCTECGKADGGNVMYLYPCDKHASPGPARVEWVGPVLNKAEVVRPKLSEPPTLEDTKS